MIGKIIDTSSINVHRELRRGYVYADVIFGKVPAELPTHIDVSHAIVCSGSAGFIQTS